MLRRFNCIILLTALLLTPYTALAKDRITLEPLNEGNSHDKPDFVNAGGCEISNADGEAVFWYGTSDPNDPPIIKIKGHIIKLKLVSDTAATKVPEPSSTEIDKYAGEGYTLTIKSKDVISTSEVATSSHVDIKIEKAGKKTKLNNFIEDCGC